MVKKNLFVVLVVSIILLSICNAVYAKSTSESKLLDSMASAVKTDVYNIKLEDRGNEFRVYSKGVDVRIPDNTAKKIKLSIPEIEVSFSINIAAESKSEAVAKDNLIIYPDASKTYSSGVLVLDEGIKQITMINTEEAPNEYVYELDLPDGAYLEFMKHFYTGEILDGSIKIYDANGNKIGGIDAPRVVDADGIELDSNWVIKGSTLVQKIELIDAAFPVVSSFHIAPFNYVIAESADIFTYFTSPTILWDRDGPGLHSISLGGRTFDENTRHLYAEPGWYAVKDYYEPISQVWYNEQGLYDQYFCHNNIAQRKDPWNIEPWRPNCSFVVLQLYLCNYPDGWWD